MHHIGIEVVSLFHTSVFLFFAMVLLKLEKRKGVVKQLRLKFQAEEVGWPADSETH